MDHDLSRLIKASQIKDAPQSFEVTANEAARAALAARFGLPGIARLSGMFVLRHERGGVIAASLFMQARVTQTCVVTLEPFAADVQEETALRFVPAHAETEAAEELSADSLDDPDEIPYADGEIDLGAALAEQLALALDPYPRKPGAELPGEALDDSANPFAALKGRFKK